MLVFRLDPDLKARLDAIVRRTGRSKSYYAREALREKIEEFEDIALLDEALRHPDAGKRISLEELKRELGLDG